MGEASVRDVADATLMSGSNIRLWINRLHADGEIKRVRGYASGGSTGFYAVSLRTTADGAVQT
jgi:DNA-binding MarR family transcriptional regulator